MRGRPLLTRMLPPDANGCVAFDGYHIVRNGERRPMYRHELVSRIVLAKKLGRKLRKNALHSCDNPWCVAEAHLYEGSQKRNMKDCASRGRFGDRAGEANGRAVLSDAAVADIKSRKERNYIYAARYGVSRNAISDIWHGRSWLK